MYLIPDKRVVRLRYKIHGAGPLYIRPENFSITFKFDPDYILGGCPQVLSGRATAQCGLAGRRGVG